jgi:hypothetical protein
MLQALQHVKANPSETNYDSNNLNEELNMEVLSINMDIAESLFNSNEIALIEKIGMENFNRIKLSAVMLRSLAVMQLLMRNFNCRVCLLACHNESELFDENDYKFLRLVWKDSLFYPSESIVLICDATDKVYDRIVKEKSEAVLAVKNFEEIIGIKVMNLLSFSNIFPNIGYHLKAEISNNHHILLIKSIIALYIQIKKKETLRRVNEEKKTLLRHKMTHLMNLQNQ